MGDLSPHFSTAEFRCKGHGQPGHRAHRTLVDPQLVERLELLRAAAGDRPLVIISGHRCAWWNRQVGGAPNSRHRRGQAADIRRGYASPETALEAGFTGVGHCAGWAVHVDVRPRRRVFLDC